MDLNQAYAQHQHALIRADGANTPAERHDHLAVAGNIASRISDWQRNLGAAAACAWSAAHLSTVSLG